MKKTILAVALGLVAGSVSAANIYTNEEHGVNVEAHGAAEIQVFQGFEFYNQEENLKVRIDDGELNFLTTVELGEQMKAMAFFDFEIESGTAKNDQLWVGLNIDHSTIKAGRINTAWDDTGIGRDYELAVSDIGFLEIGNPVTDVMVGSASTFDEGDNSVRYDLELGQFKAAIAHNLKETTDGRDKTGTDGMVGATFGDFEARAFYQVGKDEQANGLDFETNAYTIEADYNMGDLAVSASYTSLVTEETNSKVKVGFETVAASGEYSYEDLTIAGGLNYVKTSEDIDTALNAEARNVYVNITKQLHPNVRVYGEVGYTDITANKVVVLNETLFGDDDGVAYVAGMEVKF